MGEDIKPNVDIATDEEARLRDRLQGKKVEKNLRERLMAKKDRRQSESDNSEGINNNNKNSKEEGKNKNDSPIGSDHSRRGRRSSSMEQQRRRDYGRPRGGRGNDYGGRPWDNGGPPSRGPPSYEDRFGRAPPPGHYAMRDSRRSHNYDDFGRAPRRYPSRSRSRSISRSYSSRSRSRSRSLSSRSRSRSVSDDERRKRGRSRRKDRRRTRRRRSRSFSSSGSSVSSSSSSSSSSDDEESVENNNNNNNKGAVDNFTKDQRTVFVNQLVMRTTSKDIRRYFSRKVGAKVNEVVMLKDRRTGKQKGCAYVELKSMDDVGKALGVSGQPPDFQRFPILVKPSEAEKNYIVPASTATVTANMMGAAAATAKPMIGPDGRLQESQKVYVGNLDPSITQEHLFKLFSEFGNLTKVSLQMDPASGISKGYAFLSFRDPKEAHLAISAMANQVLAGKCMKTGWATMTTAAPGVSVVTSELFPEDASVRAQKAQLVLTQLALGAALPPAAANPMAVAAPPAVNKVPTVAEARNSLATSAAASMVASFAVATTDAKIIGRADQPSQHLLIQNMYDKDEETEPGWADDIAAEFREECSKFGTISHVLVMQNDPGGKIYASFDTVEAASNCASSLAGRWFDKRQLRVEYVNAQDIPKHA
ncbi:RNA-binding protein 39 [Seminavis robusta]|uniref:RNA-binding protein 39 n=1 Tax=Seminavis robusta TaxID=568900 RepID=A0A9N8EUN5_9STRA|nr:RNA-binding protein 39 [Seminavis robusta]|eukprot:Sro2015_g311060.1 RNA-binding protein 39 (648) ;mRNA; f:8232-10175